MIRSRGYTLVEVMMSLVVLAIGATGIYSLQAVAIHANEHARNMTDATNVARFWLEHLRRDALNWNGDVPHPASLATTEYLQLVDAPAPPVQGAWFTPVMPADADLGGGAAQQAMGRELDILPEGDPQGLFCTHMRLSWIRANQLIRAEVRVWWYRPGADRTAYPDCGVGVEDAMGTDITTLHWVYLASTLEPPS